MGKAAKLLTQKAKADYPGVTVGKATCPDKVLKEKDATFECTLDLGGKQLTYKFTQTDAKGNVTYKPTDAVLEPKALASEVAKLAGQRFNGDVKADCGAEVQIVAPQDSVQCRIDLGNGEIDAPVVVKDVAGALEFAPKTAFLSIETITTTIADGIKKQAGVTATVDCGDGPYRAADVGTTFDCSAKATDGSTASVTVDVKDADGNIEWKLQS